MSESASGQYYHQLREAESYQSILHLHEGARGKEAVADLSEDDSNFTDDGMSDTISTTRFDDVEDILESDDQLELDEIEIQYQLQSTHDYTDADRQTDLLNKLEESFQKPEYIRAEYNTPSFSETIRLHRQFQQECHKLDSYVKHVDTQVNDAFSRDNMRDGDAISTCLDNIKDLYLKFLVDYIDQKYQIISLQDKLIEMKEGNGARADDVDRPIREPVLVRTQPNRTNGQTRKTSPRNKQNCNIKEDQNATKDDDKPHILILKYIERPTKKPPLPFDRQCRVITEYIDPANTGIEIKSIGPTRKHGLVLSFKTEIDQKKAFDILIHKVNELRLYATLPHTIYPKMIIHSIGANWNKRNLKYSLIKENKGIEEAYDDGEVFDIVFMCKASGEVILRVSPGIRHKLKQKGCIDIGSKSYKVSDKLYIKRCYRCHQFGHFSSKCASNEQKCGHCNKSHSFSNCPDRNDPSKARCVNCLRSKLFKEESIHRPTDLKCPTLRYEEERLLNKIDFGKDGY